MKPNEQSCANRNTSSPATSLRGGARETKAGTTSETSRIITSNHISNEKQTELTRRAPSNITSKCIHQQRRGKKAGEAGSRHPHNIISNVGHRGEMASLPPVQPTTSTSHQQSEEGGRGDCSIVQLHVAGRADQIGRTSRSTTAPDSARQGLEHSEPRGRKRSGSPLTSPSPCLESAENTADLVQPL